jgi:predicted RNA-binding protein with RPS1 domain
MDSNLTFKNHEKFNTQIKLTPFDKKNGTKVYCTADYAQELYDLMFNSEHNDLKFKSKDLTFDDTYTVVAKSISYDLLEIHAEEINTNTSIIIPFKEYSNDVSVFEESEDSRKFLVRLYKSSKTGEHYGSEKKARSVAFTQELFNHLQDETWFAVKLIKLIKGGYLALYKDEIECFIPGSLAAANVIKDFGALLNTTINVMVDNYDPINNLFILSYKKYVIASMSTEVQNINFEKEYRGILTTNPLDFGIFVEIDNYFTGLIHKSEFKNYESVRHSYKTGDSIPVFVKDVTLKKGQYRIVLTLEPSQVSEDKKQWIYLKQKLENQVFSYELNDKKNCISIELDENNFEISIRRQDMANCAGLPYIKIWNVDVVHKKINFEFFDMA